MRLQEEIDNKRKAALLERERLTELLIAEKKNNSINSMKIQNQWRKVMRLAKVETLKKDIEVD